jgi:hypothetical protein
LETIRSVPPALKTVPGLKITPFETIFTIKTEPAMPTVPSGLRTGNSRFLQKSAARKGRRFGIGA